MKPRRIEQSHWQLRNIERDKSKQVAEKDIELR